MNKNDLRNAFESIPENEDEKMLFLSEGQKKKPMNIRTRLILGVGAAILICGIGLALPSILEAIIPATEESTQVAEQTERIQESVTPVVHANVSGLFTITTYTAEWTETVLQPNVSVELTEYSPAQSDVPGLPFIITVPEETTDINTDSIRIDVDYGSIVTWNPPDYTIKDRGKTYVISTGDTIYWSPLDAQGNAVPRCEMTITAYNNENEAYSTHILISQTEDFLYSAKLQ